MASLSPKPLGWVSGVRCLGLFPKKPFTPSLSPWIVRNPKNSPTNKEKITKKSNKFHREKNHREIQQISQRNPKKLSRNPKKYTVKFKKFHKEIQKNPRDI